MKRSKVQERFFSVSVTRREIQRPSSPPEEVVVQLFSFVCARSSFFARHTTAVYTITKRNGLAELTLLRPRLYANQYLDGWTRWGGPGVRCGARWRRRRRAPAAQHTHDHTIASESVYSSSRYAAVSTNMTGVGRSSTHTCDPETHTRLQGMGINANSKTPHTAVTG